MKNKYLARILLSLLALMIVAVPVMAATWEYYFPFTVIDDSGSTRTQYPVLLNATGQNMVDGGYVDADGLNTNMQEVSVNREYMLSTTEIATVIDSLPSGGQRTHKLYTGYAPDQTDFAIIAGEDGYLATSDSTTMEVGQDFEISLNAYINTDVATGKDLVDKQSSLGLSITDDEEITGIVYYDEPVDVTPAVFGAWTDVDVSEYIPNYATGVIVHCWTTSGGGWHMNVRMNGSTDNRWSWVDEHDWQVIGVDSSGIFETYLGGNLCHVYLVGFTGSNFIFNTNADDVSIGAAGAWTAMDLSAEAPSAIGVIIEVHNLNGGAARAYGVRKNGSADNRVSSIPATGGAHVVIGCDSSQIIEGQVSALDVDFFLVGYITAGATFNTNADDISIAAGAWTDIDLSALVTPNVTHVVIEVHAAGIGLDYGLRRNGSVEAVFQAADDHYWSIVECDSSQIIEGRVADPAVDFFLVGYFTAQVKSPYELTVSATGIPSGEYVVKVGILRR